MCWICAHPARLPWTGWVLSEEALLLREGKGSWFLKLLHPLAHRQVGVQAKELRTHKAPFITGVTQIALQMNHSCVLTFDNLTFFTICCGNLVWGGVKDRISSRFICGQTMGGLC